MRDCAEKQRLNCNDSHTKDVIAILIALFENDYTLEAVN